MKTDKIYLISVGIIFLVLMIVFDTFPRTKVSMLEKRELATFPTFSVEKLKDGSFTKGISSWFSDSEPFRDKFMELSMAIKGWMALSPSDDNVTFHASNNPMKPVAKPRVSGDGIDDRTVDEYENNVTADENAKIANAGIIIVGKGDKVRALMAYGGGPNGCLGYAKAANTYKQVFGNKVNVYCMVIPTAVEFYCPEKAKNCTNPQRPTINNVYTHLLPAVKPVDIYSVLGRHAKEDIFLRTDHHWAPLGAFYAAQEFARVAKVPFRPLKNYERKVVKGYVGSMYGYSNDISVKNAPEDFVYYEPKGIKYTTTYINYTVNKNFHITKETKPIEGPFFWHYRDGSPGAYCTFMGGDTKITVVRTGTKNGRRLIILKDSFGNALPGFLFFSFEEIHVIDSRYFNKNMKAYVKEHKITDILFANNIFKAYSSHTYGAYMRFLKQ